MGGLIGISSKDKNGLMAAGTIVLNYQLSFNGDGDGYRLGSDNACSFIVIKDGGYPCMIAIAGNAGNNKHNIVCGKLRSDYEIKTIGHYTYIIRNASGPANIDISYFTLDNKFTPVKYG